MEMVSEKATKEELEKLNVKSWPVWEKEACEFEWMYDEDEAFYVLEGKATVTSEFGDSITFGKGDLVFMPKGLKCTWKIMKPIKKHYKLG